MESIPKDLAIGLPNNYGVYKIKIAVNDRIINVFSELKINTAIYPSTNYNEIKEFYKLICKEFNKGEPNGRGVHTYPTGEKYDGEFKGSLYHGKGTQTFSDGRKYVGEFRNGKANGIGSLILAKREKYAGDFTDGMGDGKAE